MTLQAGGRRRSFASSSVAQLSSSLPRPEVNLQRLNTGGFHADIVAQATHCVDTKRLELAIKGSGARIKVGMITLLIDCAKNCVIDTEK